MRSGGFVPPPEILAEPGGAVVVADDQVRKAGRFANGLLLAGDRLFGFHDRCIRAPEPVRSEPVGFENVLQSKTGVKKCLVVFAGAEDVPDTRLMKPEEQEGSDGLFYVSV